MMRSITAAEPKKKLPSFLRKGCAILFWIFVWETAFLVVRQEILLVSPWRVVVRLSELIQTGSFWQTTGASLMRIMVGYLLAVVGGVMLALLTSAVGFLRDLFYPLLSLAQSTPIASFIILALVWIRAPRVPTFIVVLTVLPVVWANVEEGIRSTDRSLLEVARVFRFSRAKTLRRIYFPSVLPYLVAGCSTGLGLAWKSGISAEVLSLPREAVGTQIYNAKIYLETADLFAWTLVVILLSVALEKLIVCLMKKAAGKWKR